MAIWFGFDANSPIERFVADAANADGMFGIRFVSRERGAEPDRSQDQALHCMAEGSDIGCHNHFAGGAG
ncbi:hypothetical protein DYI37_19310 [Fulvimarina endophytica]|uniref:Uncharacterized protein n=1 Tax=Fulvimarina endophytica TaxID=2293836 RepID=A0A371WXW3_9HYPH|nr:hypothetical protein DYI37_19310 [Fulvimarina endophytica]